MQLLNQIKSNFMFDKIIELQNIPYFNLEKMPINNYLNSCDLSESILKGLF